MRVTRPFRLRSFPYVGRHRYLLTFCTAGRRPAFSSERVVGTLLTQLRHAADASRMAVIAYCFMPDHVHLLVEGTRADAELTPFVSQFKQKSGYWYGKVEGQDLWQAGFHDYVLRAEDETVDVACYVLANPIRAGMTARIGDYPFAGSDRFDQRQLRWDATNAWQG